MQNQHQRYITEKEVAKITGRGLQTLRNDRHRGRGLPYIKMGRSVRYSLEESSVSWRAGKFPRSRFKFLLAFDLVILVLDGVACWF